MNMLLVESDDVMRSLFQAALERDGFHVMTVKNNQEGLAASGAVPFWLSRNSSLRRMPPALPIFWLR